MMTVQRVIPVFFIFNYTTTIEFYVDWLGFQIDWEHRFDENCAIYIQVSLGNTVLHLSDYYKDVSAGGMAFIECEGLEAYHKILTEKQGKFKCPILVNGACMTIVDPFTNQLVFSESTQKKV